MAPNKHHPDKVALHCWIPKRLKDEVSAKATAEGITVSDVVVQALEEWLRKPPTAN